MKRSHSINKATARLVEMVRELIKKTVNGWLWYHLYYKHTKQDKEARKAIRERTKNIIQSFLANRGNN